MALQEQSHWYFENIVFAVKRPPKDIQPSTLIDQGLSGEG
jgi:hypothetical protein